MDSSTLLTTLATLAALLTAIVYFLQMVELLEKRIPQVISWIKKHKSKRIDTSTAESLPASFSDNQYQDAQENPPQLV